MLWFNSKEKRKKMEFIQNYVPTSKAQLLQVAMFFNKGDIQKAQEMFDFYAKNLDLPDFDPVAPTMMQQVRKGAVDLFSWIKENQSDIVNGYEMVRQMTGNRLPPLTLPTANAAEAAEPLPEIN